MNTFHRQQQGVVLVVSLLLLLLLTILAITAARTSSLQQRMAGNAQEQNVAFQAAESGLARWLDLFTSDQVIPGGDQEAGNAANFRLDNPPVNVQANCMAGSLNVSSGFVFDCHHVTSSSQSAGGARARHQMGYLVREGQ